MNQSEGMFWIVCRVRELLPVNEETNKPLIHVPMYLLTANLSLRHVSATWTTTCCHTGFTLYVTRSVVLRWKESRGLSTCMTQTSHRGLLHCGWYKWKVHTKLRVASEQGHTAPVDLHLVRPYVVHTERLSSASFRRFHGTYLGRHAFSP